MDKTNPKLVAWSKKFLVEYEKYCKDQKFTVTTNYKQQQTRYGYNWSHVNLIRPRQVSDYAYYNTEPVMLVPTFMHVIESLVKTWLNDCERDTVFRSMRISEATLQKFVGYLPKYYIQRLRQIGNVGMFDLDSTQEYLESYKQLLTKCL